MSHEHAPQKETDEIAVVRTAYGTIIKSGYVCSTCGQPVYPFEDPL